MFNIFFSTIIVAISLLITMQGIFTLSMMLHAWNDPDDLQSDKDEHSIPAKKTFSLIVPARNEAAVIAHTLNTIATIDYPNRLWEVIVVCQHDDAETIAAVTTLLKKKLNKANISLRVYDAAPYNKPHALNFGLKYAKHEIVGVLDAEDEVYKSYLQRANALFCKQKIDVLQMGIQLIDVHTRWYSALNVLEYYTWFKSVLRFFSRHGVAPLAGNSVFFTKKTLQVVNGWDERSLTEDAEIGLRINQSGKKTAVHYHEQYVTKEETPPTVAQFVKQRTRWNQGFLQIIASGDWKSFATFKKNIMSVLIFSWPIQQIMYLAYFFIAITFLFKLKLSPIVVLISIMPMYVLIAQLLVLFFIFIEFSKTYKINHPKHFFLQIGWVILPYFGLLTYAAARAVVRYFLNDFSWEKTNHTNAHRTKLQFLKIHS